MNAVTRFFAWFQSKEPAWFQQNSWVNESVGGVLGTILIALGLWFVWAVSGTPFAARLLRLVAVLLFNILSAVYEWVFDPSTDIPGHVPLDDFGQRAAGSLLAAWIWCGL